MQKFNLYMAQIGFGIYLIVRAVWYYGRRHFSFLFLSGIIFFVVLIKFTLFPPYTPQDIEDTSKETVYIPRGSSLRNIASILNDHNIIKYEHLFLFLGKVSGYQHRLKAGLFEVPKSIHPWHLLIYLTQPDFADIKVTLPEGIKTTEIAAILQSELEIDSTRFMQLASDTTFLQSLGIRADYAEGYLLPETYFFTYGVDEREVMKLLITNTLSIFEPDSVQQQLEKVGMNRHQIITLASIIEGEVVVDSERVIVSSVYHNRLERGWLLQADPTVQYILPGPPRRLLLKDLEIDSPYNTYRYKGLPPGPINNPGKKSILAALFPADTRYMYFVATGDGGHNFARTASEHARNKAKFDRVRREVRRNRQQ